MAQVNRSPHHIQVSTPDIHTVLKMLRVGQEVDLLLTAGCEPPQTLWRTTVLDRTTKREIVVTPAPTAALLPSDQQTIEASVLSNGHPVVRVGFRTIIVERTSSAAESTLDALVLQTPTDVYRANLRGAYRAPIPNSLELVATLDTDSDPSIQWPTTLIDLSATGALLTVGCGEAAALGFHPGDPITLELDCRAVIAALAVRLKHAQQAVFRVPCQVLRITPSLSPTRRQVALKFVAPSSSQMEFLHTLVLKIQQWITSRYPL